MNAAATLIAGFGLLADSDAVIIGAMLIAMLYGPIIALGLALAELDKTLLKSALAAEIIGASCVLLLGLVIGGLSLDVPIGNQLLARTSPNILDLLIALIGGAAGAYAAASPKISGAVVGVAIATALCPPLTACGILLAHGLTGLAAGALLLFVTNLTAITVAAMTVFLILGHGQNWHFGAGWATRAAPLAVLSVLAVYLLGTFRHVVEEATIRSQVKSALEEGLKHLPGTRIIEVRLLREQGRQIVFAVARSPTRISNDVVAALDSAVDRSAGRDITLYLRTVLVEEQSREGIALSPQSAKALPTK
ncbi:MAG: DUF389 domain-containing protein [Hyphomicrobiaceae bacterium]